MNTNIIDDNLKGLGINSIEDLQNFIKSIKDINETLLVDQLVRMGLEKTQIELFYTILKK